MKRILVTVVVSCLLFTACGTDNKVGVPTPEELKQQLDGDGNGSPVEDSTDGVIEGDFGDGFGVLVPIEGELSDYRRKDIDVEYTGEVQLLKDYDFDVLPFYLEGKVYSLRYSTIRDLLEDGWTFDEEGFEDTLVGYSKSIDYHTMHNADGKRINIGAMNVDFAVTSELPVKDCNIYGIRAFDEAEGNKVDEGITDFKILDGIVMNRQSGTLLSDFEENNPSPSDIPNLVQSYEDLKKIYTDNSRWHGRSYTVALDSDNELTKHVYIEFEFGAIDFDESLGSVCFRQQLCFKFYNN